MIRWHEQSLLPDTAGLASDPRTALVEGDFFTFVQAPLDPSSGDQPIEATAQPKPTIPEHDGPRPERDRYDAILLDIDHTPTHVLHPSHAAFYSTTGLGALRALLKPEGVFGLWSDDPADDTFVQLLSEVFESAWACPVEFRNPLTLGVSANTVYLARG